jgi:hypothetical protein
MREFLHVDDLADACLFLMEHYSDDSHINVGTGVDLPIRELAEKIRDVVNPAATLVWDRTKPDGTPRKVLDVSRSTISAGRRTTTSTPASAAPTTGSSPRAHPTANCAACPTPPSPEGEHRAAIAQRICRSDPPPRRSCPVHRVASGLDAKV